MKYIKGLDSLRAIAIIAVFFTHWWLPMDINEENKTTITWFWGLMPEGGFGVDLFFVLSGFLITSILLKARDSGENKRVILRNFIVRRSLRIFPIYYLTTIFLIAINYPSVRENAAYFLTYTSNVMVFKTEFFNEYSHTWSLSVEEQFYLIWPLLMIFLPFRNLKYVFGTAIIIGVASCIYFIKIKYLWSTFALMPMCLHTFGIGGLYAYYYKTPYAEKLWTIIKQAFPAAVIAHFYWSFGGEKLFQQFDYVHRISNAVIAIWLIHQVIHNKSEGLRKYLWENPVLVAIGKVSYGLYLYHYVIPFLYNIYVPQWVDANTQWGQWLLDWKINYFIRLVFLIVLSFASFYLFEKPILRLKKYFEYDTHKDSKPEPEPEPQPRIVESIN